LHDVAKVYPDGTRAVSGFDLEISDGEFKKREAVARSVTRTPMASSADGADEVAGQVSASVTYPRSPVSARVERLVCPDLVEPLLDCLEVLFRLVHIGIRRRPRRGLRL
jgi:hypothetical protein